jgi:hypothetical protein
MKIDCQKYGIKSLTIPVKSLNGSKVEVNKYLAEEFKKLLVNEELTVAISDNDDFSDDYVEVKIF